tara:strand:+ start:217 stop:639 length:423 start_codon:yes stop_codon:yes gene_type:complete
MDIEKLLSALDNEKNEQLINLTSVKLEEIKNNVLQSLQLDEDIIKDLCNKLKEYRYCGDLSDIKFGQYIRWIPLTNPDVIKLTRGAILCDYKVITDKIHIICKSGYGRIFQIKFDEVELFQKLSYQEKVLLKVLDMLDEN